MVGHIAKGVWEVSRRKALQDNDNYIEYYQS